MSRGIRRNTITRGATPTAAAAKSWPRFWVWAVRTVDGTTWTVHKAGCCEAGCCEAGCCETAYFTRDNPGFGLRDYMQSVTLQHKFEDWLMYQSPGSATQWVSVAHFVWSLDGGAVQPARGWNNYVSPVDGTDSAGTVDPSGTETDFTRSNSFPEWTQIDQAGF